MDSSIDDQSNSDLSEQTTLAINSPDSNTKPDNKNCTNTYFFSTSSSDENDDFTTTAMKDNVTAQLATAGPVGVAAAAAIASSKKKNLPHLFETNPIKRKRRQNSLLKRLRKTMDEYVGNVEHQAVVLLATPKTNINNNVFGAKPLEDVIKNLYPTILNKFETALKQQTPPLVQKDPIKFELPRLVIDGIPTNLDAMSHGHLRRFIPRMLKYSTGRGKPGWGRASTRPPWWPVELPWESIRVDRRTDTEKLKISWTQALRQVVINCYKYHGREDLLSKFTDTVENLDAASTVDTDISNDPSVSHSIANVNAATKIVQVDINNPVITFPDGNCIKVPEIMDMVKKNENGEPETDYVFLLLQSAEDEDGKLVYTIQNINKEETQDELIGLNSDPETTLSEEQLILIDDENYCYVSDGDVNSTSEFTLTHEINNEQTDANSDK